MNGDFDDLPAPAPAPQAPRSTPGVSSLAPAPLFRNKSYQSTSGNSSDAPVFSSDDLAEASIENYHNSSSSIINNNNNNNNNSDTLRRRRATKRRWWGSPFYNDGNNSISSSSSSNSTPQRKRAQRKARRRAPDSGVFLASDSGNSSSSADDGFSVEHMRTPKRSRYQQPQQQRPVVHSSPETADVVLQTVNKCVEEGAETVDLSHLALTDIADCSIQPLKYLIRRPRSDQPGDGDYQTFTPDLKLFLSANLLTAVPSAVVFLENLTVLSLRNNRLKELPSSIGRLHNLVEFNVAGNNLRWLPWELLRLTDPGGKLVNMNIFPNPFFRPFFKPRTSPFLSTLNAANERSDGTADEKGEEEVEEQNASAGPSQSDLCRSWWGKLQLELHRHRAEQQRRMAAGVTLTHDNESGALGTPFERRKQPVYLGSSPVALYELDGSWARKSVQPASSLPADVTVVPPSSHEANAVQGSRAPSLFELALRSCSHQLILDDSDLDILPTPIQHALERGRSASREGGRVCSICSRAYVLPRAEWIEYWHCSAEAMLRAFDETFVPFLRRSCSWSCTVV